MELGVEEHDSTQPEFGDELRRALGGGGRDIGRENAARLAAALLSLSEKDLLVVVEITRTTGDYGGNGNLPGAESAAAGIR